MKKFLLLLSLFSCLSGLGADLRNAPVDIAAYPYGGDRPEYSQGGEWVPAAVISGDGSKPSVCASGKDYLWGSYAIGEDQQIRRRSCR